MWAGRGRERHVDRGRMACRLPTGAQGAAVPSLVRATASVVPPGKPVAPNPHPAALRAIAARCGSAAALQASCSTAVPKRQLAGAGRGGARGPYMHGGQSAVVPERVHHAAYHKGWALLVTGFLRKTHSDTSPGRPMGASLAMRVCWAHVALSSVRCFTLSLAKRPPQVTTPARPSSTARHAGPRPARPDPAALATLALGSSAARSAGLGAPPSCCKGGLRGYNVSCVREVCPKDSGSALISKTWRLEVRAKDGSG